MEEALAAWAECGAMALTGDPDGPPLAPPTLAALVAARHGAPFGVGAEVLGERAAIARLQRQGAVSCGRATRLVAAADGWVALALPREDDVAALPALAGVDDPDDVAAAVRDRPAGSVAAQAALLGVPCAVVGSGGGPFRSVPVPAPPAAEAPLAPDEARVLDLTALWAGPLCAHLLGRAGAAVLKVEDEHRVDGARFGPRAFFALLNDGKEQAFLDLAGPAGRAALAGLVRSADVVVTGARQRAVRGLGLDPLALLASGRPRVWVAVTAHGWDDARVGFGDDAAAAAGLVAWGADGRPRFAGDAVADPLCGLAAAAAARRALLAGGCWFVDASLSGAAAAVAGSAGTAVAAAADGHGGWRMPSGAPVREPRVVPR